ncbi:MAG TPA: hypothetical protein VML55_02415 [Planctomycetaceae bacterium]|nr:hypothetical protein [Planctomycetaceae bacterium]
MNAARRAGYTLVELLVSSVSATILMAGLASALFIAGQALEGRSASVERCQAADVQSTLLADLEHATSFVERTSDVVTFTVPDRNGDGAAETLSYSWTDAAGGELRLSVNGGPAVTVLSGVKGFELSWSSRDMRKADPAAAVPNPDVWGERW